jgi:hypothetical protein
LLLLVDTSVWIDFLAARPTRAVNYFREQLDARQSFALTELIYLEILQGIREPATVRKVASYLRTQAVLHPRHDLRTYEAAADLYRRCRGAGVTVRSTIDCLIAQLAMEHNAVLLHDDRDYVRIAQVDPRLKLAP